MLAKLLIRKAINYQRKPWYLDWRSKDMKKWIRDWKTKIVGNLDGKMGTVLKIKVDEVRRNLKMNPNGVKFMNFLNSSQAVPCCVMTYFVLVRRNSFLI